MTTEDIIIKTTATNVVMITSLKTANKVMIINNDDYNYRDKDGENYDGSDGMEL